MDTVFIQTPKTLPVHVLGEPGPAIRQLWIACHGYAQLASSFLEDLQALNDGQTLIVCPEGSNYFYQKGFSGPVVANWMTRHNREHAIQDNAVYLQQVYDLFVSKLSPDVRIVLLGFSQGTATVCRWVINKKPVFNDMVLWAGLPPEDLNYQEHASYFSDKNLYLIYGTNDPFLTEDRMELVKDIEEQGDLDFEEKTFQGGHEIPATTLKNLKDSLGN
ncbi:MAG: hypothetical protein R2792_18210 [Saprospiraceae bacterium]